MMNYQNCSVDFQLEAIFDYEQEEQILAQEQDQFNYPKLRKYNSLFNAVQAHIKKEEEEDIFARYFQHEKEQQQQFEVPQRKLLNFEMNFAENDNTNSNQQMVYQPQQNYQQQQQQQQQQYSQCQQQNIQINLFDNFDNIVESNSIQVSCSSGNNNNSSNNANIQNVYNQQQQEQSQVQYQYSNNQYQNHNQQHHEYQQQQQNYQYQSQQQQYYYQQENNHYQQQYNYVQQQQQEQLNFPQFNNNNNNNNYYNYNYNDNNNRQYQQYTKLQQQKSYSNDSNQSSLDTIPSTTMISSSNYSMNKSVNNLNSNMAECVQKKERKISSRRQRQSQTKLEFNEDTTLEQSTLLSPKPVKEKKSSKSSAKKSGNNAKKNCAMIRCQKNLWKNFFSIFLKHLDQNYDKIQEKLNKWFPQEDVDIFNHYYQYTLKKQKIFNKAQVLKTFFPVKYQTQNIYFYKSLLIKKILRILAYEFIHTDMFQSILLVSRVKKWEYFIQQKHKLLLTFQTYSQNLE